MGEYTQTVFLDKYIHIEGKDSNVPLAYSFITLGSTSRVAAFQLSQARAGTIALNRVPISIKPIRANRALVNSTFGFLLKKSSRFFLYPLSYGYISSRLWCFSPFWNAPRVF